MWRGPAHASRRRCCSSIGFLVTFLFGGLTGVILASPPLDFQRHRLLLRGRALPLRGVRHRGVRDVRRLLLLVAEVDRQDAQRAAGQDPLLDCCSSASTRTFLVQHWLGAEGMPRRYADYRRATASPTLNLISIGRRRSCSGASTLPFLYNVWHHRASTAPKVTVDDPWGYGNSLEWATSCPPPRHNFTSLPRIRSERPAFDLHHPHARRSPRRCRAGRRRHEAGGLPMKVQAFMFFGCGDLLRSLTGRRLLVLVQGAGPARTALAHRRSASPFMIGFYLLFTVRRLSSSTAASRPRTTSRARSRDGAGELGFFSPHSWWPLFVAPAGARPCARLLSSAGGCC